MVSTLDMIEVDRAAVETFESTLRDELRVMVRRGTYSDAGALLELAREFVALGETEDALDCFGRVLEKDPSCWEAYVGRAEVVLGLYIMRDEAGSEAGLGSWACSDLEKALTAVGSENRSLVYRLCVTAYLVAGRYEQARELASRALAGGVGEEVPERNDLVYCMAFAELFLNNAKEALKLFRSLPRSYEAGLFGEVVYELCKGNFDAVRSLRVELSERYLSAVDFLSAGAAGEVTNYLDVARSLCIGDVAA